MYKEVKVVKQKKKQTLELTELWVLDAIVSIPTYLLARSRFLWTLSMFVFDLSAQQFSQIKLNLVSRMFWGRGSLYRSSFHFVMAGLTTFAIATGIASQILAVETGREELATSFAQGPTEDFLQQGSSIQTVSQSDPFDPEVGISKYTVIAGDSLKSIAKTYNVTKDTIRWANNRLFLPFSEKVKVGWKLRIPEMNGVLYKVKPGDTVNKVAKNFKGHPIDIIELNNLQKPKYKLSIGAEIFVPNGEVPPPPPDVPYIPPIVAEPGTFVGPLLHPSCRGYIYMRGFTGYHRGLDLSKGSGCPINSVASGRVIYAGYDSNWYAGYHVIIDHGGGVTTEYWHGNGTIWVRRGDFVEQGQPLLQMGSTGNSTGTHLHFIIKKNGVAVNAAGIVPY